jgi:sec-independent protein translocase protein TatA
MLILAVLLLFFGANKIPQLARGLGQGMSEFRKASQSVANELQGGKDATLPTQKVEQEVA